MSSVSQTKIISTTDLDMMQLVLTKAGYTAKILTEPRNAATMLFLRLFEEGLREPGAFALALESNFGKQKPERKMRETPLHRFAIQGRQTTMDRPRAHKTRAAAYEAPASHAVGSSLIRPLIEISVVAALLLASSAVYWLVRA